MSDHYERTSPVTGKTLKPMEETRYLDFATFMRTPLATTLEGLDVGMLGVPLDSGVTNRPGTRHGPREIRNQSSNIRKIHPVTRIDPFASCKVADVGDVVFESMFDLGAMHQEVEEFVARLVDAGVVPLTAGGDHSITYPILKPIGREQPVALLHIDAHCDTGGIYDGAKFHHGGLTSAIDWMH